MLASLNHANIAAIYGLEEADGVQALVLELVEGPTLAESHRATARPCQRSPRNREADRGRIESCHERGVIHRDLKPANIKVRADGAVKILDFGLAKALDQSDPSSDYSRRVRQSPTITRRGAIFGTAAYMSPEQARGAAVDTRSDIWAFGCILYEMLTGRHPFRGDTDRKTPLPPC